MNEWLLSADYNSNNGGEESTMKRLLCRVISIVLVSVAVIVTVSNFAEAQQTGAAIKQANAPYIVVERTLPGSGTVWELQLVLARD